MSALLDRHLDAILAGTMTYAPQPEGVPTYYPRRRAEDGAIDWQCPAALLHDYIRAITRPYPGAFSDLNGTRYHIWAAQPFGFATRTAEPGTITEVFSGGELLVHTGDEPLLITDYEPLMGPEHEGQRFSSVNLRDVISGIELRYPASIAPEQREIVAGRFSCGGRSAAP